MATALLQSKQHENYVVVHGDLSHISDTLVEMAFRRYGAIVGVERKAKAVTLVFFSSKRSVNYAVNAGKGTTIAGVEVKISPGTTNSMEAAKKKISLVCFAFRNGTCKKGDGCKLTHDPFTKSQPPAQKAKTQKNTIQTCRMNLIGKCSFTDETCRYRHTKIESDPTSSSDEEEEGQVPQDEVPPAKSPVVSQAPKTCAECERVPATMICETCGDVGLCASCDGIAHATKIMSRHVRVKIEKPKPKCAECRTADIRVHCDGCQVELCADCSWKIHAFKIFRGHKRHQVDGPPAAATETVVVAPQKKQLPKKVEQKKVVKPVVKSSPKPEPVVPKKTYYADSDDSSSTDGSDERYVAPSGKSGVEQLIDAMSSESESSSDSEDEDEPAPAPTPAPKKQAPKPKKQKIVKPESDSETDTDGEESKDSIVVPGYAPKAAPGFKSTAGISSGSVHSVVAKIEAYMNSSETEELHMSSGLNSYERLLAHDCAERLGLEHASVGTGIDRHIVVTKSKKHSLAQTENGRAEKKRRSH